MRRSYQQHCAVAKALDVIGERWTLLLVRELLLGPRRYKDFLNGLPGIGTNLLAERLRELEAAGLVRRRKLPPPAGSTVYELTELGNGLRPAVLELGRWGARLLGPPTSGDQMRAGWYVVSMLATARPDEVPGADAIYELRLDEEVFQVRVRDGEPAIGSFGEPALVLATDVDSFVALLSGELEPAEAIELGRLELEGSVEELVRFLDVFRWPVAAESAPSR